MTGKSQVQALAEGSPVIRWLMTEGRHITDAKSFLESFAACVRDAGVDVSRITTGVPVTKFPHGWVERKYSVTPVDCIEYEAWKAGA